MNFASENLALNIYGFRFRVKRDMATARVWAWCRMGGGGGGEGGKGVCMIS